MQKLLFFSFFTGMLAFHSFAFASPLIEEASILLTNNAQLNEHPTNLNSAKSVLTRQKQDKALQKKLTHPDFSWSKAYQKAKQDFLNATGISYTLDASILAQRGAPNGKGTPWQSVYYGSLNWDLFQSERFGSGSIQVAYTLVRYWGKNGAFLGNNIGIASGLNDYLNKANYFDQLSYTHQFSGPLKWLSLTLGQFPLYNFDGTTYNSNQQINFISEAFSQNLTAVYPTAGIGGYISITPNDKLNITVGAQDASNISGNRITTSDFKDKKATPFVSLTLNDKNKLGTYQASLLFYYQPSVLEQVGKAKGVSFNFEQNIYQNLAIFMRANGVSKGLTGFKQSYMVGAVLNNPLNRNPLDQIGLAYGLNKLDKSFYDAPVKSYENLIEAYWAFGITPFLTLTPDVQFYINPALNQKSNTATVASLRASFMF